MLYPEKKVTHSFVSWQTKVNCNSLRFLDTFFLLSSEAICLFFMRVLSLETQGKRMEEFTEFGDPFDLPPASFAEEKAESKKKKKKYGKDDSVRAFFIIVFFLVDGENLDFPVQGRCQRSSVHP